jgi:L-2,4-diaminobutyric acid acetyltransferase
MWALTRDSGTLDLNSPYYYLTLSHQFADTCILAKSHNAVVGFIAGFRPPRTPDTLFVWQITVAHPHRRQGVAREMLRALLARLVDNGVCYLEATVTPRNLQSQRMFRSFAERLGASCEESLLYPANLFPGAQHGDERLLRIGPFIAGAVRPREKPLVEQGGKRD